MNVTALVKVADGAAHVVERYVYDPYGKVTVLNGESGYDADGQVTEWSVDTGGSDWANEILYCGYRFDLESGLYHVRHRYYHPTLGRWVSRDPAGYTLGMSLYEYCGSSPAYAVDPSGMQVFFPQYLNPRSGAATSSGGPGQQRVKLQGTWDADVGLNRGPGMAGLNISMHGDFKLDTKYASCCTKLDIIQTAETYVYNDLSILDAESDTHIDGTGRERPFYGFARPYNHREEESGPGFPAVDTHDDPGKALGWSATRELWQNFETCAVCTEGSEKGQVISCIYWGQHWRYEFKDADGTYVYTMSFYLLPEVRSLMVRLASTGQIKSSFVYDPELARKLKKNPGLAKDWIQYRGRGSAPSGDLLNLAGSKYYYVGQ
jgi:RHS repeat-associated protein